MQLAYDTNVKTVSVELSGGLGNQLFQAYASLSLAMANQASATVFPGPRFGASSHGNSIASLDWGGRLRFAPVSRPRLLGRSAFFQASLRLGAMNIGQSSFEWIVSNDYVSQFNLAKSIYFRGYFQNVAYFENVSAAYAPKLRDPSNDYLLAVERATQESPIGVHIRLGDYKNHLKTHGLLPRDYYVDALRHLDAQDSGRQVWLFSDSPQEAASLLEGLIPKQRVTLVQLFNLTDLENLFLYSACEDLVLGNSTFSLWGALLGAGGGRIIRPENPFIGLPINTGLYPSSFETVEVDWKERRA